MTLGVPSTIWDDVYNPLYDWLLGWFMALGVAH